MDRFKDAIVLTTKDGTKFLVPKSMIINVIEGKETDYTTKEQKPKPAIIMSFDNYKLLGLMTVGRYVNVSPDSNVVIDISEDFKLVSELLKNSVAFQVLHGEK